jgi:hypothetical protein
VLRRYAAPVGSALLPSVGAFKASAFTLTAFPTRDVARGDPNVTFGLLGSTSYRATP